MGNATFVRSLVLVSAIAATLRLNAFEQGVGGGLELPSGTVIAFAGTETPGGWLAADGRLLPPDPRFSRLCAVLGDRFRLRADPVGSCRLPDLQGRVPVGEGQGAADGRSFTPRSLGELFGSEMKQLSVAELPSHSHSLSALVGKVAAQTPGWAVAAQRDTVGPLNDKLTSDPEGGGQPFALAPPSIVLKFIVKL